MQLTTAGSGCGGYHSNATMAADGLQSDVFVEGCVQAAPRVPTRIHGFHIPELSDSGRQLTLSRCSEEGAPSDNRLSACRASREPSVSAPCCYSPEMGDLSGGFIIQTGLTKGWAHTEPARLSSPAVGTNESSLSVRVLLRANESDFLGGISDSVALCGQWKRLLFHPALVHV